ncbi:MAG: TatD family hydrolase [Bryobacteraceae bacterium]|nr:TatD family hydrolase [Bryobacteraceae bacterium]MDW8378208.1 TatD family hydrolase [Bryobacterales bacterium]
MKSPALIDSHCHLDAPEFDADRQEVIERAFHSGLECLLAIGTGDGPPDLQAAIRLADSYSGIYATVGVHPHHAAQWGASTLAELESLLQHPKVVALGEIGLDYHYDFAPRPQQQRVFAEQLALARRCGVPVIIHTREAWEDTLRLLEEHAAQACSGGIMHCFTGGASEARRCLDLGFFLSFSGIVTFPKATAVHEAARLTPLERLLLETDSPYLAPLPHRGKRNEPSFVVHVARRLAELRGESYEQVLEATSANFRRLCLARKIQALPPTSP